MIIILEELLEYLPEQTEETYNTLKTDIQANGIREPITYALKRNGR